MRAGGLIRVIFLLPLFLVLWQILRVILLLGPKIFTVLFFLISLLISIFLPVVAFLGVFFSHLLIYMVPYADVYGQLFWLIFLAVFLVRVIFSRNFKITPSPVYQPLIFLFLYTLSALFVNRDFILISNIEVYKNIFYMVFFYFLTINVLDDKKKIQVVLWVILISSAIVSLFGIYQFFTGYRLAEYFQTEQHVMRRVQSFFLDPNNFGAYLIFFIPVGCGLFFVSWSWRKFFLFSVLFLMILGLVFTFSAGAFLGLMGGFLLTFLFLSFKDKQRKIFTRFFLMLVIIILVLFFLTGEKFFPLVYSKLEHFTSRLDIWVKASAGFLKNPFFGIGINGYRYFYPKGFLSMEAEADYHSGYLKIAGDFGFLGLFLWGWVICGVLWDSYKLFKKNENKNSSMILWGLLAGLIGYLVFLINDLGFYSYWPWLSLSLLSASANIGWQALGGRSERKNNFSFLINLLLGAVIFLYFIFGFFKQPLTSNFRARKWEAYANLTGLTENGFYAPIIKEKKDLVLLPDNCWMARRASIYWINNDFFKVPAILSGQVMSFKWPRKLQIFLNDKLIWEEKITATTRTGIYQKFSLKIILEPGLNKIEFVSPDGVNSTYLFSFENNQRFVSFNFKKDLTLDILSKEKIKPVEEIINKVKNQF